MQSSYVSSDFIEKLLNFENVSPSDNEIASLMDTTVHHEEPSGQTYTLFTVPITVIPTTIPPPPHFFNPLPQQATPTPTPTTQNQPTSIHALPDTSSIGQINDISHQKLETDLSENEARRPILVDTSVRLLSERTSNSTSSYTYLNSLRPLQLLLLIENVTELLEAVVLAKSSSQPKSTYEAAASLSEYELTKILLDKMEESKSHLRADYKRKLYDALVNSYNTDKDLFNTYGKEGKSSSSSKGTSRSHHKSSGKYAHAEEPSHAVDDSGVQKNQEFGTGNNDEQLDDEAASKNDWFKKPERPPTPDPDWNKRQYTPIDFTAFVRNRLTLHNLTQELLVGPAVNLLKGTCKSLTKLEYHFEEYSKAITKRLNWHNLKGKLYPFDLRKPFPLILDHRGRQVIPQDYFINNDLEYLKGGILSRQYSTSVTKNKLLLMRSNWIEDMVPNLWSPIKVVYDKHAIWVIWTRLKFVERISNYTTLKNVISHDDLPTRQRGHVITTVQQRLTNLTVDECYDLNVALRMFTKRIVIQRWVEDLQLGVESYQKKLNITKTKTIKSNLRNRTAYTAYSDISTT
ncbi:hypothetical protein Tco_1310990 [Tanacetum coccineum]